MPRVVAVAALMLVVAVLRFDGSARASAEELLVNGGFESGVSPWSATFGQLDAVDSPVHGGAKAARLSSSNLQSHEIYRAVPIAANEPYILSGWAAFDDPDLERVFLRVSWFNAGGGLVSQSDSAWITIPNGGYQPMTTGPLVSPSMATSARIGVRVQASGPFEVYVDELSFTGTIPQPTAPPTPSPPPTPNATPTPAPPTKTPKPTATTKPTASPKPTATPSGPAEPGVFDTLTNGGFEMARADGTPYAWKDVGADLQAMPADRVEGTRSLAVTSRTSSTKWAYQTVRVQPGQYYDASAYTWNASAEETFIRVSWYASSDGSGSAIDSVDSISAAARGTTFKRLTTGPVLAPDDAQTARVRLMVRPGSDGAVIVYFDAATFGATDARPAANGEDASPGHPASSSGSRDDAHSTTDVQHNASAPLVENSRLGFANVRPAPTAAPDAVATAGSNYDWLALLGVLISVCAIAFAVWLDWSRRRRTSDPG